MANKAKKEQRTDVYQMVTDRVLEQLEQGINQQLSALSAEYQDIVEQARLYIHTIGGFEKFAEWGLIRANTDLTD